MRIAAFPTDRLCLPLSPLARGRDLVATYLWQPILKKDGELSICTPPSVSSRSMARSTNTIGCSLAARYELGKSRGQDDGPRTRALHCPFSRPARHSRKTILATNSIWLGGPDARFSRTGEARSARK